MSVYVAFSDAPATFLASNQGWRDFCAWADGQDGCLCDLSKGGECEVADLHDALMAANTDDLENEDVVELIGTLLILLDEQEDDDPVLITNGVQPDGDGMQDKNEEPEGE